MRALPSIGLVLSALAASTYAQDTDSEIERIEAAIAGASDFQIFQKLGDIPSDVIDAFRLRVPWDRMAEWGEPWNSSDIRNGRDEATRQHVFSAVSPTVAVVVFRIGGRGLNTGVVVAERNAPGLCIYYAGDWIPDRVDAIRESIAYSPDTGWSCIYLPQ